MCQVGHNALLTLSIAHSLVKVKSLKQQINIYTNRCHKLRFFHLLDPTGLMISCFEATPNSVCLRWLPAVRRCVRTAPLSHTATYQRTALKISMQDSAQGLEVHDNHLQKHARILDGSTQPNFCRKLQQNLKQKTAAMLVM